MKENFEIIAIHILSDCPNHIRKVLEEDEWYFFNRKYKKAEEGGLVKNDSYSIPEKFYSDKINIQAIVGKNGSGKSSVIEVMLRLINNLAYNLISNAKIDTELNFVEDLNAEIFFEINNVINSLKCLNNKVYLDQGNGYIGIGVYLDVVDDIQKNSISQNVSLKEAIPLLQKFFFTIVNNYSFHAYNANDFKEEFADYKQVWINGLFHKNDGYLTPLVLNPFRDFGKVDLEKEKYLTNIRLASLFYLFKKEGINFIPDYEYQYITFKLDESHVKSKYITKSKIDNSTRDQEIIVNVQSSKTDIFNTTLNCYFESITENERLEPAYKYLVYKTFSISAKYPNYIENRKAIPKIFNTDCSDAVKLEIKNLVNKIKSDPSHITLKIRQTLKFIDFVVSGIKNQRPEDRDYQYFDQIEEEYIDYKPKDTSIFDGLTYSDQLIANFPPPFYTITMGLKTLKKEIVTFEKMSSGERQFLFYMSTLLYHLKNIDSVVEGNESIHYKYVNIILEEVELYFHPEYQRQFVCKLIKYIEACRFNNTKYFNFIIATHSPFILSDIPNENIMFLKNGKQVDNAIGMKTFGANIIDMLKANFFMDNGFMGEFAKEKITSSIKYLKNEISADPEYLNTDNWSRKSVKAFIDTIGEPLIQTSLLDLFYIIEKEEIQREIDRLISLRDNDL